MPGAGLMKHTVINTPHFSIFKCSTILRDMLYVGGLMALYHSVNVSRGFALTNSAHQAALASAPLDFKHSPSGSLF